MILFDVNVLIYATNPQASDYHRYRAWLEQLVEGNSAFGVTGLVLSSYLRIVTNRRVFTKPSSIDDAVNVTERIRSRPNCIHIEPGPRHWNIFVDLARRVNARGNLVPDAYLAAIAIESGCEWLSADRDYARFPGLRWRHPLGE